MEDTADVTQNNFFSDPVEDLVQKFEETESQSVVENLQAAKPKDDDDDMVQMLESPKIQPGKQKMLVIDDQGEDSPKTVKEIDNVPTDIITPL